MKVDNNILAQFQMLASRIVSLNIKNDSISSDIIHHGKKFLDVSHEIVSVDLHNNNSFIGVVQINISIRITLGKAKFSLKLTLEGGFSAPQEMGEEMFRKNAVIKRYCIPVWNSKSANKFRYISIIC